MSSLLQFNGQVNHKGVRLEAYRTHPDLKWEITNDIFEATEYVQCTICNEAHPQLYGFYRKPAGMFGPWVVFRYNKEEHVPDLSVPLNLEVLPRDAKPFSPEENSKSWHS